MGESRASSGRAILLVLCVALLAAAAFFLRGGRARGGEAPDSGRPREERSSTVLLPADPVERELLAEARPLEPEVAESRRPAGSARSETRDAVHLCVTGRVVDEQGAPIEGAEVRNKSPWDPGREIARSDASGVFSGGLTEEERWLLFEILADGRLRAERRATSHAREVLDLGTIVLAPGGEVRGRVVEVGGRAPVEGSVALVAVEDLPAGGGSASLEEGRKRFQDLEPQLWAELAPDGSFRLRGAPPGEHVLVAGGPGGFAWSPAFRLEAGAVLEHELVLPRADESHWIEGRVFAPDGEPRAGIALSLNEDEAGLEEIGYAGGPHDATSGEDGRFRFPLSGPATFTLRARDQRRRTADLVLPGVTSGRRDLELHLEPVRRVEVRLRDGRGRSIAWGNVWGHGLDSPVPLTPLGETGVGEIPFIGSELVLEADAPGFARGEFGPYRPADVARGLELVLVPGGFVRGRVTSGGRPVRGARLDLSPSRAPDEPRPSQGLAPDGWPFAMRNAVRLDGQDGTSDNDGRFVLSVPVAAWHALRVEADGFPLTVFGPYELDPARANPELEVELARGGALEGRMLLAPGEAPLGRFVGVSNGWSYAHTTAVDAEGRFRFDALAPGEWQVRPVEPPVAALQPLERGWQLPPIPFEADVVVRSGATTQFELDSTRPRGVALVGRFVLEGVPLDGWRAELQVLVGGREVRVVSSGLASDGSFRLVVPREDTFVLRVTDSERSFRREVRLAGPETRVELAFTSAWAVVEATEEPVRRLHLAMTCADGTAFQAWPWDFEERWRLAVPSGSLRLGAIRTEDGELEWSEPVELAPGEERTLALPPR